jgi:DNA-binding transcriptional regulator YbjK
MADILVEVQGVDAIAATEDLLAIPGVEGSWQTEEEVQREGVLAVMATIVGLVGGTMAIAEQIRKWYQEYRRSQSGKRIEKVLIVGRNGQRLLLENATIEQIQKILDA